MSVSASFLFQNCMENGKKPGLLIKDSANNLVRPSCDLNCKVNSEDKKDKFKRYIKILINKTSWLIRIMVNWTSRETVKIITNLEDADGGKDLV